MIFQTQLEEKVYNSILDVLASLGYEPVRIRMLDKTLQILIDRLDGKKVNIKDCETASRDISVILDVEDLIHIRYNLEVGSPGIDRPLTRKKDFINNVGNVINVTLISPLLGRKRFKGLLKAFEDDKIVISVEGSDVIIEFDNVQEANLNFM